MPGSTSTALVPILRQLRRVRRRWNAREAVRATLLLAATSGVVGALLVLAALGTAPRRFVVAATLLAVAWLAGAVGVGLAARRRRPRRRSAHHRVDRHAHLGGRLAALVDLGSVPGGSALRPLLAAENAAMLPLWAPRRLVPRRVPTGALAAAVAAAAALAAAVAFGPVLAPPPPPAVVVAAEDGERLPLRRGRDQRLARGGGVTESDGRTAEEDEGDEGSLLDRAAEAVQHRLHRELWGEAEAIRAEQLARSEARATPPDPPRAAARRDAPDAQGGESSGRVEPGAGETDAAAVDVAEAGGTPEAGDTATAPGVRRGAGTADGAARGAGTGTSPDLYGAPAGGVHRTAAPFTLGLTARVHGTGGGPRPPRGETPLQLPDANPALAERAEEAIAVPRAPVPPEYAAIVRRLFERAP